MPLPLLPYIVCLNHMYIFLVECYIGATGLEGLGLLLLLQTTLPIETTCTALTHPVLGCKITCGPYMFGDTSEEEV